LASWFEWQAFLPQKNKAGRHRIPVTGSARVPKRAGVQLRRCAGIVARSDRKRHEFALSCSHYNASANSVGRPTIEVDPFSFFCIKSFWKFSAGHLFAEEIHNHHQMVETFRDRDRVDIECRPDPLLALNSGPHVRLLFNAFGAGFANCESPSQSRCSVSEDNDQGSPEFFDHLDP
jgi:hypothetical protein